MALSRKGLVTQLSVMIMSLFQSFYGHGSQSKFSSLSLHLKTQSSLEQCMSSVEERMEAYRSQVEEYRTDCIEGLQFN